MSISLADQIRCYASGMPGGPEREGAFRLASIIQTEMKPPPGRSALNDGAADARRLSDMPNLAAYRDRLRELARTMQNGHSTIINLDRRINELVRRSEIKFTFEDSPDPAGQAAIQQYNRAYAEALRVLGMFFRFFGVPLGTQPADTLPGIISQIEGLIDGLPYKDDFKNYVHSQLTFRGVPENPNPEETERTGCRIGQRLKWLFDRAKGKDDLLETAWGIIANAGGGNWELETEGWREAAARFRRDYFQQLPGMTGNPKPGLPGNEVKTPGPVGPYGPAYRGCVLASHDSWGNENQDVAADVAAARERIKQLTGYDPTPDHPKRKLWYRTAAGKLIDRPRTCCREHLEMDCNAMTTPLPNAACGLLHRCKDWGLTPDKHPPELIGSSYESFPAATIYNVKLVEAPRADIVAAVHKVNDCFEDLRPPMSGARPVEAAVNDCSAGGLRPPIDLNKSFPPGSKVYHDGKEVATLAKDAPDADAKEDPRKPFTGVLPGVGEFKDGILIQADHASAVFVYPNLDTEGAKRARETMGEYFRPTHRPFRNQVESPPDPKAVCSLPGRGAIVRDDRRMTGLGEPGQFAVLPQPRDLPPEAHTVVKVGSIFKFPEAFVMLRIDPAVTAVEEFEIMQWPIDPVDEYYMDREGNQHPLPPLSHVQRDYLANRRIEEWQRFKARPLGAK